MDDMKKLAYILLLVLTSAIHAQSKADDEVQFNSAVDWLNSKLDYIYYDDNNEKWWNNNFYINEERVVTIKQISSKTPQTAKIKEKTYTIRKFHIEDINPYNIQIKVVEEGQGRFVKGKLLEIHTFDNQPKIAKTLNNRKATSTSFLHLSFPKVLTDSLANYPELVKEKLYQAVIASTKVYPNEGSNKEQILEILEGKFKSEETNQLWVSDQLYPNVLKIESENSMMFFGYDEQRDQYFLNTINQLGVEVFYFQLVKDLKLILENTEKPESKILFATKHSFCINGEWFYRI